MGPRDIAGRYTPTPRPKSHRRSAADDVHFCLLALAEAGNSPSPIAARIQSQPHRLESLLGKNTVTAIQATGGSAYNFITRPFQYGRPRTIQLDKSQQDAVVTEIARLQHDCHAVEEAPPHDGDKALLSTDPEWEKTPLRLGSWPKERRIPIFSTRTRVQLYDRRCLQHQVVRRAKGLAFRDFESPVFTVPKKDGNHRLCTDYRKLNFFQKKTTFKMDDTQLIAETIQRGDYGMLVDLKDAYLTLGLHPSHRKYCRFRHPRTGRRLQWRTVSFGISEAPRICTKLLRPLMAILKQLGIRCIIYIDDILLLHQDALQLARSMAVAINLLQHQAGLNLKTSKYSFRPLQRFQCLGYVWDTALMRTFVPNKRLKETHRMAKRLLSSVSAQPTMSPPQIKTRILACFVGQAVATFRGIRDARRHLIYLQHDLGQAVRRSGWNGMSLLTPVAIDTLQWWASDAPWQRNGQAMVPEHRPIQISVKSNAATETMGWGGTMYDWVEQSSLQLSYRHLRGIYNTEADSLSRHAWAEVEWHLDGNLLKRIQGLWRCALSIDLFASRHNAQADIYYSWHHDFVAAGVDSLHHNWHCKKQSMPTRQFSSSCDYFKKYYTTTFLT
jgi:hypothetical protein